jgi:hypothetical protein
MSVPRGKSLPGSASDARMAFQDASDDLRSFYALGQMLKGRKAALKHLTNVGRGTFVLISALWESYCEALELEAATLLVSNATSWEDLPPALSRRIAVDLRNEKHELSPWKLAGDGWKTLTLDRVAILARETVFNSPKPAQVDDLFLKSIGLVHLSGQWTDLSQGSEISLADSLKEFVALRGAIAHGATPRAEISKPAVSAFYQTVYRIVVKTDEAVGLYLEENGVDNPWERHVIEPMDLASDGQPLANLDA